MANNVLTKRVTVAAVQSESEIINPGTGKYLVIDWIQISVAGASSTNKATLQVGAAAADTVIYAAQQANTVYLDYRSPSRGSGLKFAASATLRATTGTGVTLDVVVGYHIDSND